jgi:LPXTG-motif cell wall-anchored protein
VVTPTEDNSDLDETGPSTQLENRDTGLNESTPAPVTQLAYANSSSSSDAVQAVPATGDSMGLWAVMGVLALTAVVGLTFTASRKENP